MFSAASLNKFENTHSIAAVITIVAAWPPTAHAVEETHDEAEEDQQNQGCHP